MKLSITAAATLPLLASGYSMGPLNSFGRPVIITNAGPCGPGGRCAPSNADKAFADLKNEIGSSPGRRRRRNQMSKEEALRQQEWLNRAFGLATEAAAAVAGVDIKEGNEALRQQQEWLGRAFGVDVGMGGSPRYQVNDTDEAFQVAMDVPGVKQSDIDINLEDNVLTIQGERDVGIGEVIRKENFSKSFTLDSTVEEDKITAKLNNGVLLVTAPKNIPVPDIKKIPVMQVAEEDEDDVVAEIESSEETSDDADADQADAEDKTA